MMNVLVFSHMFPSSADPMGGIFVLEQMKALRGLGVEIVVVAPVPWIPSMLRSIPRGRKYYAVPPRDAIHGFHVEYPRVLSFPGGRLFCMYGAFYYLACLRAVRHLVRDREIQMIHAHAILPDGFAGVLLGQTLNLPVVCTVHGSDINIYPFRNRCTRRATIWALRRVDRLITVSHRLRENVVALAGPLDAEVVHNGADPTRFAPMPKRDCRSRLNLPLEKKIVLFVGNLSSVKGVEFLLKAFAKLELFNTMLYVVGDGVLREPLCSLAANLGVQQSTVFVGQKPHEEIPLWLSAADCLVMPSLNEGLPTLLAEAILCRVPIVATEVGGIPEILRQGDNAVLVRPKDPVALTGAIRAQLAADRRSFGAVDQAEASARAKLTWEANAEKTLAVYRRAVFR